MKGVHLCLVVLLVFGAMMSAQARPLVVGFHDWAPNQYLSESQEARGIDINVTQAIFDKAKIDIEFRHYPWKRILYLLERGEVDVAMSAGFTEERNQFARFSGEVYRVGQNAMFICKARQAEFAGITSLSDMLMADLKLGVTLGVSYSGEYETLIENRNFNRLLNVYEDDKTKFDLLSLNRLDALLVGKDIGFAWIERLGLQDEVIHHMDLYPREEGETWLMFSKKSVSQNTVEQVDEAIKTLRASGKLKRIEAEAVIQ